MKKVAFGPLNLKPGEFWSLTPAEFGDLIEGYNWRKEQQDRQLIEQAWLTAYFQRVKKLPSLSRILKNKAAEIKKLSKEERKREWEALQKQFGL